MNWLKKQSLYMKIMYLAALLTLASFLAALSWQWEMLFMAGDYRLQRLLLQSGLSVLVLLFLADRLAVRIAGVYHQLAKANRLPGQSTAAEDEALGEIIADYRFRLASAEKEREKLLARVREKEALKNSLLQELIAVQEEERRRISRELHDEAGQALTTLLVSMRILGDGVDDPRQRKIIESARDLASDTLHGIRDLAVALRPPTLDDLGLVAALNRHFSRFRELHGLALDFCVSNGQTPVTGPIALTLYRIVQEALTNIVKHAAARSVLIRLVIQENHLQLTIQDDGCGYEAGNGSGIGIYGMIERAKLLGGSFRIEAKPGAGTLVSVVVPNLKEETSA